MVPTATVTLIACVCVVLYRTVYTMKFMPCVWMHSVVGGSAGSGWSHPVKTLPLKPLGHILCSLHPFREGGSGMLSPQVTQL